MPEINSSSQEMMVELISLIKNTNHLPLEANNKHIIKEKIEGLINNSVNLNFPIHLHSLILLSYVIRYHDTDLFKKCVQAGANINIINGDSTTSLMQAIMYNKPVLDILLKNKDLDFWHHDDDDNTLLEYMAINCPEYLLKIKNKIKDLHPENINERQYTLNKSFIYACEKSEHQLALNYLMDLGANPQAERLDYSGSGVEHNYYGLNALTSACIFNKSKHKHLKYLSTFNDINEVLNISYHANYGENDHIPMTSLSALCMNKTATIENIQELLDLGLDKSIPEHSTCLQYILKFTPHLIDFVLDNFPIDCNYPTSDFEPILQIAVNFNPELCNILLDHGADEKALLSKEYTKNPNIKTIADHIKIGIPTFYPEFKSLLEKRDLKKSNESKSVYSIKKL